MAKAWTGTVKPYSIFKDAEVTKDNEVGAHNKKQAQYRRECAQKAAKASAKVRKENARERQVKHLRSRSQATAIAYPVRHISLKTFRELDARRREELGIQPSERGTMTLWAEYRSCMRCYSAKEQGFLTSNGQRARALKKAGRPRCTRTIQRAHHELTRMGLLRRYHIKRSGARRIKNELDCLSIHMQQPKFCHPAVGSTSKATGLTAGANRPLAANDCAGNDAGRPGNDRRGPPESQGDEVPSGGGDDEAVKRPLNSSDKEESSNEAVDYATTQGGEDPEPVRLSSEVEAQLDREGVQAVLQRLRGHPEQPGGAMGLQPPQADPPRDDQLGPGAEPDEGDGMGGP